MVNFFSSAQSVFDSLSEDTGTQSLEFKRLNKDLEGGGGGGGGDGGASVDASAAEADERAKRQLLGDEFAAPKRRGKLPTTTSLVVKSVRPGEREVRR